VNPHYAKVAGRAGHRCEYCYASEAVFNLPFEIEHIVPMFRGGDDSAANLALACRACNLFKAAHVDASDPESDELVRLFNPRQDRWADHFQVDPENIRIVGRTPAGRATVGRLRLNREAQMAARQQWIRLGLFP